ncbi:hypothetical protein D3C78_1268830 [compost metagenome]
MVKGQLGGQLAHACRVEQQFGTGGSGFNLARIAHRFIGGQVDVTTAALTIDADAERQLVFHQRAGDHGGQL